MERSNGFVRSRSIFVTSTSPRIKILGSSDTQGEKTAPCSCSLFSRCFWIWPPVTARRPVHILCNDTLVESPILMAYIDKMLGRLQIAAESLHLPIVVVKTTPDPDQTFWVN